MTWTKPTFKTAACGMEVSMYAPDEQEDVLFRTRRLADERAQSVNAQPRGNDESRDR